MSLRALSIRLPATHPHPIPHQAAPITGLTLALTRPRPRRIQHSIRFFSAEFISHPSNLVQVYISRSTDPYLNLSIEHFLLRRSHADAVVLLLYTNRPCVVLGRNQNPWVEVDLGLVNRRGILRRLRAGLKSAAVESENGNEGEKENASEVGNGNGEAARRGDVTSPREDADDADVLLVRRRSGGGTVFHDAGNVNYSVICPPAAFDRDKHAEMVVRALRGLLNKTPHAVRVNERHDIVLDIDAGATTDPADADNVRTFKISGSAYKLTRTRSLHHGTCLLSSPHLPLISRLLRSPAAPYIKARGVESVRSPVRNVGGGGISTAAFEDAVVAEFLTMYEARAETVILDPAAAESIPEVRAGVAELRSLDWIYAQTPQFVFSSHPTADDPRPRPDLPADLPSSFFPTSPSPSSSPTGSSADADVGNTITPGLQMTVRHGQITEVIVPGAASNGGDGDGDEDDGGLVSSLKGLHLHHIDDWRARVGAGNESVGRWLNRLFGVGG